MHRFSGDVSIVLGGAAGQGIQTIETLLVQVLKREGYHVSASKEYMSRIRGGSNSTEVRISTKPRAAFVREIDFLFVLDKDALHHLHPRLGKETIILGEKDKVADTDCRVIDAPFTKLANEIGHPIFASTIAVGVVLGMLGADQGVFHEFLRERFARKGDDIVDKNIAAAKKGHALGVHLGFMEGIEVKVSRRKATTDDLLLDGGQAVGLGALAAGCNFISSYPMSPGTSVLTFLAERAKEFGVVVDQAEDEIAAINMALGAWYAGARAIVTTSGGGFDLMTEGISLSGIIETPIVVHIGQRPGPATGLPTRTEQADLNLARYGGHGEFPRAIYAPGTVTEAFHTTQEAFRVADQYQVPAIILTDQYFIDRVVSVPEEQLKVIAMKNAIIETNADYKRYALTENGISPRGVPGYGTGLVGVDSDEHDEEAHITESHAVRVAMHEKRLKKLQAMRDEALPPVATGNFKKAKVVIITWGSNYDVVKEALEEIDDPYFAQLHFSQVFPLSEEGKKYLPKTKSIVVVENNWQGQFADLLEREYGVIVEKRILQYDGAPFSVEDLVKKLSTIS